MIDTDFPHNSALPGGWEDKLSLFMKLLVLRCFRPEKLVKHLTFCLKFNILSLTSSPNSKLSLRRS